MASTGGDYIHGTNPEEQRRLSLLNNLMNETSIRALRLEGGEKVLDVGSGLGQLAIAMARTVAPDGCVVGVERDAAQLGTARRDAGAETEGGRIEFRQGDATRLPLGESEWGSFDAAHARFLLEHVPDPQAVVGAMVRAVRSGGRVILEDDDHDVLRLWPEPEGVYDVWRAYIESYKKIGNDPFVGRRLVSLLHTAGAVPTRNHWNFFGSCSGDEAFPSFVENFVGVLEGARETILESTAMKSARIDKAISEFKAWGSRPDSALWYCTYWAEGRRPE